eukprot:TRINITY_DN17983_c0_g1_i4.p1 TRINITY_DN17983_c0_g1~~TRINITY_DN17983_c0_g1_i4.p1  ORF type:complete len:257 (-),score=78.79 TRINITY_DN17983_c0_g1_i4:71-841(-)
MSPATTIFFFCFFFFFNDTATTEIYTRSIVGSVRCVQETGINAEYMGLPELYLKYNVHYEATLIRIARDTILQEVGNYEAPDYWLNRTFIGDSMRVALNESFMEVGAQCISLQMLRIVLPETYENQIVLTQVEVQKKRTKEYEQQAAITRAQIQVDISEVKRTIANITATAKSQSSIIRQEAVANALKTVIEAESSAYKSAMSLLNFSSEEMMKYVYYPVSYTHLRAHETSLHLVCRLLLEKKKKKKTKTNTPSQR